MNDADFKDKSSRYMPGKELIIVIVVIFSSLSFTLGYFVGRNNQVIKTDTAAQMAEVPPVQQVPEQQPAEPVKSEDTPVQTSPKTEDAGQTALRVSQPVEKKVHGNPKEIPAEALKDSVKETVKDSRQPAQAKSLKAETGYTVQVGAIKNEAEAENLKAKLEKKGYKTYITVSKNKKREKIYKVRTGEFRERKDAEILSLKLKKTEGLNTFVTFSNE